MPTAQRPIDPTSQVPFPNGIIPVSRFRPNSKRLLANYPAPNFTGAGGNLVFPTTQPLNTNQYIYKFDYYVSPRNQIAVHYLRDYYTSLQNLTTLVTYDRNIPGINSSAKWTFVANPTTVNTAQFTFSGNVIRQIDFLPNPIFINDFTRKGEGISFPLFFNAANDIPSINISGYNSLNAAARNWNNFNRVFQWKDDFSKLVGNHNLRFGVLAMRSRKNQDTIPPINGTFTFSTGHPLSTGNSVADALIGNFSNYTEGDAGREGWFRFTQIEFYGQTNWKVSSRLSLDMGLRYYYMQPQYSALQNVPVFEPQYYDPKRAVTVLPTTGQIVPGSGDRFNGIALGGSAFPDAATQRITAASDPAVNALFRGLPKEISPVNWGTLAPRIGFAWDVTGKQRTVIRGGYGMFVERITGNFVIIGVNNPPFNQQVTVYSGSVDNPAGGQQPLYPSPITSSYNTDLRIPVVQSYSLGVQHKLTKDTLLDVAFVGSNGWHEYRGRNLNQLPEGTLLRNPGVNQNALRPFLGFGDISQWFTGSTFDYNSMQAQVKKQLPGGGAVNVGYTFSRAITDASNWNEIPMDSYNYKRDRGLAAYDRRHVLVLSYIYPLPFWQAQAHWYGKIAGGWELSGITTIQSGRPLDITISTDQARIGSSSYQRPDAVGDWQQGGHTPTQWFNTAAFALPALGRFGNLGRNVVIGPGTNNWDASVHKNFRLTESLSTTFRAEVFNAPHHFSYYGVATILGPANFGQVNSASDPRTLQFTMRLDF